MRFRCPDCDYENEFPTSLVEDGQKLMEQLGNAAKDITFGMQCPNHDPDEPTREMVLLAPEE